MNKNLEPPHTPHDKVQQCWGVEISRCPKATARSKQDPSVIFAGVTVASSCKIVLPVFGTLFLVVGGVLTLASYRGPESDENIEEYENRLDLTRNLRILGPCCVFLGFSLLIAGLSLCLISRRNKNKKNIFHCPIHGDFHPISPPNLSRKRNSLAIWITTSEESLPTPQCPHSNRSSLSSGPPPSHSPLPPVSMVDPCGYLTPGSLLTSENPAPSPLKISYDVASFPHSHTTESTTETDSETLTEEENKIDKN